MPEGPIWLTEEPVSAEKLAALKYLLVWLRNKACWV